MVFEICFPKHKSVASVVLLVYSCSLKDSEGFKGEATAVCDQHVLIICIAPRGRNKVLLVLLKVICYCPMGKSLLGNRGIYLFRFLKSKFLVPMTLSLI